MKTWPVLFGVFLLGVFLVFSVVSASSAAAEKKEAGAFQKVIKAGLMSRFPDGNFHAERPISRAEIAAILTRAFNLKEREPMIFEAKVLDDVPSDHWAHDAIQMVLAKGVMAGYRPNRFYPEQKASRAEAFAIIAQAYGVFAFEPAYVDRMLEPYSDSAKIPEWGRKAWATAVEEGFVNVTRQGDQRYLHPQDPMTRGDMAYALAWWVSRKGRTVPPDGL